MKNTASLGILDLPFRGILLVFIFLMSCCSSKDFMKTEQIAEEALHSRNMEMKKVAGKGRTKELAKEHQDTPEPREARKKIYNGKAALIVDEPEKVRGKLEELARDSGGYVGRSTRNHVVLRIPAPLFQNLFQKVLTLGKVEYQETSSLDVTEAFGDINRLLGSARQTRERLYRLLEETKDSRERAEILKEIGRLTEEIEALKQQLQILKNHLAFSRITVNLKSPMEEGERPQIPFDWIARLDPLVPVSKELKARVSLEPGPDFAVFSKHEIYLAEDAAGCSISISSLENRPMGDSTFWQKALLFHKKDYYSIAEKVNIPMGGKVFRGVRFVSKDRAPYLYIAGLLAEKKTLHVLEIFSPDAGRDLSPLFQALKEGEIR